MVKILFLLGDEYIMSFCNSLSINLKSVSKGQDNIDEIVQFLNKLNKFMEEQGFKLNSERLKPFEFAEGNNLYYSSINVKYVSKSG